MTDENRNHCRAPHHWSVQNWFLLSVFSEISYPYGTTFRLAPGTNILEK